MTPTSEELRSLADRYRQAGVAAAIENRDAPPWSAAAAVAPVHHALAAAIGARADRIDAVLAQ